MTDKELTIDDIVLDIPETKSKGYLRRQLQTASHQKAMLDSQQKITAAQEDIDRLSKGDKKITPKQELAAYAKFYDAMNAFETATNASADYILNFVKEPKDKHAAREIILDLSEEEYRAALSYISKGAPGNDEAEETPDPTEAPPPTS